jgi:pyridinium-3,5-bisthiocarboxylic acid mononucleotide nickel chelatase
VRVAYVDMLGGAAGDMLMAAWVDAGLDVAALERALRTIVADGWTLVTARVERRGIAATYLDLEIPGEDHHAHDAHGRHAHGRHLGHRLRDVVAIVERSGLTARQIARASAIYRRIAEVEAQLAGEPVEEMLFHAVGQLDAILDVAGTCVALDLLGIDELRCSPFPVQSERAHHDDGHRQHRRSATPDLLRGFPQRPVEAERELVTATAAAILTTLAANVGAEPGELRVERSGYGAGRNDPPSPNVVRVTIGTVP